MAAEPPACATDSAAVAFVFHADTHGPSLQLSHAQLLGGARKLVAREHLSGAEEALAARVFAASGQARYLLALALRRVLPEFPGSHGHARRHRPP